jgi:Fe-S oxidoreductase
MKLDALIETQSDYCTYCPKLCRFSCPVAEAEARETVTPWGLMSLLRAVRREEVELTAEVGEVFFHCAGCLRCQTYCKHEHDVPAAMMAARRLLVDRGVALPGPLQGLELRFERDGGHLGPAPALGEGAARAFAEGAPVVWVPGAERRVHDPEGVARLGRLLGRLLGGPVSLFGGDAQGPMYESGFALEQAGYGASARAWRRRLLAAVEGAGRVITEEPVWLAQEGRAGVFHLWEALEEGLGALRSSARPPAALEGRAVFYHDDGEVGRAAGLYEGPRALLEAALGRPPRELWRRRREALSSGHGAHYPLVSPEGARAAAQTLIQGALSEGAQALVTPSPGDARHLRAVAGGALEIWELGEVLTEAMGLGGAPTAGGGR